MGWFIPWSNQKVFSGAICCYLQTGKRSWEECESGLDRSHPALGASSMQCAYLMGWLTPHIYHRGSASSLLTRLNARLVIPWRLVDPFDWKWKGWQPFGGLFGCSSPGMWHCWCCSRLGVMAIARCMLGNCSYCRFSQALWSGVLHHSPRRWGAMFRRHCSLTLHKRQMAMPPERYMRLNFCRIVLQPPRCEETWWLQSWIGVQRRLIGI